MSRVLGPIVQFSYVVDDLDAAITHWAEVLQVGPFFVLEHVPYRICRFRGEATPLDMSVALAYSHDVQIELVIQHNDAPSIFKEFRDARGAGLQHVGVVTDDLERDLRHFAARGVRPLQDGEADNGTRFAYLDTALVPGTMLELFQLPAPISSAFESMRRAAQSWVPGRDPPRGGGRRQRS